MDVDLEIEKLESIKLEAKRLTHERRTLQTEHATVIAQLKSVREALEQNLSALTATEETVFQLHEQLQLHSNASEQKNEVGIILREQLDTVVDTFVLQERENQALRDRIDALLAQEDSLWQQLQAIQKLINQRKEEGTLLVANRKRRMPHNHPPEASRTDIGLAVILSLSVFLLGCYNIGKPKHR